jgi:hypothetical protein
MLVALTPRHRPAKAIQSAISNRTLTEFGPAEIIIAADSHPQYVDNILLWCTGRPASTDHCALSAKQLLAAIPRGIPLPCEPLASVQGAFGGLLFEGAQRRAILFSDRFGLMPLYVVRRPNLLLVGDSLGQVISLLSEPLNANDAAWAHWLVFGTFLGSRTPFSEVLRFPPGEWWTIELPALTVLSERLDPLPATPDETLNRKEAIVQLTTLFQRAVERIASANSHLRLLVPLSGGWDSRLIAGALRRAEIPFESVTTSWDSGTDLERVCAAEVAAHLAVPNAYYELPPGYYLQVLDRYVQATDHGSVLHVWQQSFIDHLPAQPPALIFDGYAGDLLLRGFRQPQLHTKSTSEQTCDFYDHYRLKYGTEHLLATPAKRLVEFLARQALQSELGAEPTTFDHLCFLLDNRNRRNIALGPLRIMGQKTSVAFPFLDRALLDFALRVPARLRFDPTFYPELLDYVFPGLGQIISSNSTSQNAAGRPIPIHKHAPEVMAFFRETLERHPEDLGQFLDPEAIARTFRRVHKNPARYIPIEFNRLEMAAHLAQWLQTHAAKLVPTRFLQERFAGLISSFDPQPGISTQILIPSTVTIEMRRWQAFQKRHGIPKRKLPVLLTMDVEAFAPGDIYAAHTSLGDPFERLVLGRFPNQSSVLEKIYSGRGNLAVPWTLFIEMGALWRFGEQRLVELVGLLRGSCHEIALHLHPFSLPKTFFDARRLEWNSYQTGSGFARILQEAVSEFTRLWGFAPLSYRSGRFDVYDGHFQALASCGLQTDSSLYQHSPYNLCGVGHSIANRVGAIAEGILELPVTTYFDRRDPKPRLYPTMLDLDFTSLPAVFELLARAQAQSTPAVVLLAHSWSFAESIRPSGIGKVVHFAPSRSAREKLDWIIEFCAESQLLRLATCASLLKGNACTDALSGRFDGLIEINGNPDRCATTSADMLTAQSHPWQAMHPAVTVTHPMPTALLASWQSFQAGDSLYLELFGGNFFQPPPQDFGALVRLENAREILVTFRHEADTDVDLLVFFMQYAEQSRVRNESQTVRTTADPRFETLVFPREPAAETFKIAIKLLPKDTSPGWVQLDGLRLQRQG